MRLRNTGYLIGLVCVVGALFLNCAIAFIYITPSSYWVEYHRVVPGEPFEGNPLSMVSVRTVHRPVTLSFHDVLFCDIGDAIGTYYSQYHSKRYNIPPSNGEVRARWKYRALVPEPGTRCRIESTIILHLPLGFTKTITVASPYFRF